MEHHEKVSTVGGHKISTRRYTWLKRIAVALLALFLCYENIELIKISSGKVVELYKNKTWMDNVNQPKSNIKKLLDEGVSIKQDDPELAKFIRREYLEPPSTEPYNFYNPYDLDTSRGQSFIISNILNKMKNGFFLEYGVYDGEVLCNSLHFEKYLSWSGVVIEENPGKFALFKRKNRKVMSIQACLSSNSSLEKNQVQVHRRTPPNPTDEEIAKKQHETADVRCFPFYSILLALGNPTVHYVSLRGSPNLLKILSTIPWDKVDIWTLTVEHIEVKETSKAIEDYMKTVGYMSFQDVPPHLVSIFHYDVILVRHDVYKKVTKNKS